MDESKEKNKTNDVFVFQAALLQAFKGISECVSKEEFQRILTILESRKSAARKLAKLLTDELNKSLNAELEYLCNEECLNEGLATISTLREECTAPSDSIVWRPPGDVKLHLRSHDAEAIQKECQKLEERINQIEAKNAGKMKEISERRKRIHEIEEQSTRLMNQSNFTAPNMLNMIKLIKECIENVDKMGTGFT